MIDPKYVEKAREEMKNWPEWKRACGNCDPAYDRIRKSLDPSDDARDRNRA